MYDTYETTRARHSTWAQPDKIHWSPEHAFRDQPYRQLHHQKGLMGTLQVRLLEASSLKRSYWSALALGPVKHLGLSKAHGPISSYASFHLQANPDVRKASPVVSQNDHPVWSQCFIDLPLPKGRLADGEPVILTVQMMEEATAAEQINLPGVPSHHDRILGTGTVNVTSLCLGQTDNGISQVGVMDVWIPISRQPSQPTSAVATSSSTVKTAPFSFDHGKSLGSLDDNDNNRKSKATKDSTLTNTDIMTTSSGTTTGRVRILVSYSPYGLEPQPNDLVALEAFARRSDRHASCQPILPPLSPMKVLQVRDSFLLVEYTLVKTNNQKATMRLPRNAVFVIERFNMLDGAVNLAFVPADIFLSTPVGRKTAQVAGPLVEAAGELVLPALLSAKLVWSALRTTAFAGLMGMQAATHTVWRESREAQERRQQQQSFRKQDFTTV